MAMTRAVTVGASPDAWGAELSLRATASHRPEGAPDLVAVCPPGSASRLLAETMRVRTVDLFPLRRRTDALGHLRQVLRTPGACVELRRAVAAEAPRVVHANGIQALAWLVLSSLASRYPVVWHVRDVPPHAAAFRFLLRHVTVAVAPTKWLARRVAALGVPVRHIPNAIFGLDAELPEVVHRRRSGARFSVGLIGQFVPRKGHLLLLEAVRQLPRPNELEVHLMGGPPSLPEPGFSAALADAVQGARRAGIRVVRHGWTRRPDFAALDVVAIPSVAEPFGRVTVEAWAHGVPVVASAVGGLKEMIEPCVSGLLFPPGNADALAGALEALRIAPSLRQQVATESRRRAEQWHAREPLHARRFFALLSHIARGGTS